MKMASQEGGMLKKNLSSAIKFRPMISKVSTNRHLILIPPKNGLGALVLLIYFKILFQRMIKPENTKDTIFMLIKARDI